MPRSGGLAEALANPGSMAQRAVTVDAGHRAEGCKASPPRRRCDSAEQRERPPREKAGASPSRPAFGRSAVMMTPTPLRQRGQQQNDDIGSGRSISSETGFSSACSSVRSAATDRSVDSRSSRFSRLSQRSRSKQVLSTDEIEQIRIEVKRQEIKALMRHNARAYREAALCPSTPTTTRSLKLTVPKEFNLSCSSTPCRSFSLDFASDEQQQRKHTWARTLRRPSEPPTLRRSWRPELTVPEGPYLRTAARSRSSSRDRSRDSSADSRRPRSMSRRRLPRREQSAVERHFQRAAAAAGGYPLRSERGVWKYREVETAPAPHRAAGLRAADGEAPAPAPPPDTDWDAWVKEAETAEERARRARSVAEARLAEQQASERAKLTVFGKASR